MKLPTLYFTGFNGFEQFKNCEKNCVTSFEEWNYGRNISEQEISNFQISCSWTFNAIAINKLLLIFGAVNGVFGEEKQLNLDHNIKLISSNDNFCLILLENYDLYKLSLKNYELSKMNFLLIEQTPPKKSIFGLNLTKTEEYVEHIACGQTFAICTTNKNSIYTIPTRIHQFPSHVRIKKIVCGAEHALILTSNGDIYSFGASSRGQLGLGKLEEEEVPHLIDALAGIKIVDISAGAWHSAAVSSFGDLYVWGWNINGQMGRPVYDHVKVTFESGRTEMVRHKLPSVFASPEIVNLPSLQTASETDDETNLDNQFEIEEVFCGFRHTVVRTKCGHLLGSGWNCYGQLGFSDTTDDIVKFTDIPLKTKAEKFNVVCGNWCTVIVI